MTFPTAIDIKIPIDYINKLTPSTSQKRINRGTKTTKKNTLPATYPE